MAPFCVIPLHLLSRPPSSAPLDEEIAVGTRSYRKISLTCYPEAEQLHRPCEPSVLGSGYKALQGTKSHQREKMIIFLPWLYFPALPCPFLTFTDWQPTKDERTHTDTHTPCTEHSPHGITAQDQPAPTFGRIRIDATLWKHLHDTFPLTCYT